MKEGQRHWYTESYEDRKKEFEALQSVWKQLEEKSATLIFHQDQAGAIHERITHVGKELDDLRKVYWEKFDETMRTDEVEDPSVALERAAHFNALEALETTLEEELSREQFSIAVFEKVLDALEKEVAYRMALFEHSSGGLH